jgi:hypothetical protein
MQRRSFLTLAAGAASAAATTYDQELAVQEALLRCSGMYELKS